MTKTTVPELGRLLKTNVGTLRPRPPLQSACTCITVGLYLQLTQSVAQMSATRPCPTPEHNTDVSDVDRTAIFPPRMRCCADTVLGSHPKQDRAPSAFHAAARPASNNHCLCSACLPYRTIQQSCPALFLRIRLSSFATVDFSASSPMPNGLVQGICSTRVS